MEFRKRFFGQEIELDNLQLFLVLLVVVNFLFISFMMLTHPVPEYIYVDSQEHYKWTELIKKDLRFIGYRDYPKGFHLASAALSYFMPVGTAMTLIVSFSVALLLLFSYKLAFLVSNNKTLSILTALFVSVLDFQIAVSSLYTPVPQTIALALLVMASYFFLKKDWLKAGLVVGVHTWVHVSFLLPMGLFFLFGIYELIKKNRIEGLVLSIKALFVSLIFLIPSRILLNVFASGQENLMFEPKIMFYDDMISPLSFFSPLVVESITQPPLIALVCLIGLYFYRKKLLEELNLFYFFLILAVTVLLSQFYWIDAFLVIPNTIFSGLTYGLFLGSRFLGNRAFYFALIPLAFFSAKGTIKLFEWLSKKLGKNVTTKGVGVFSLALLVFSVNSALVKFNIQDHLSKEDLELVQFLQTKPVDEVVATEGRANTLAVMGLKRNTSQRNFWFIVAKKDAGTLLDLEKIDYLLFSKRFVNVEVIKHTKKVFENKRYVLLKLDDNLEFKKTNSLRDGVLALIAFLNVNYNAKNILPAPSPFTVMLLGEDTKEKACVIFLKKMVNETIKEEILLLESCPQRIDFLVKGKKEDLMELLNSYDFSALKQKFVYLYNQRKISFTPARIPLAKEDLRYFSCVNSRTSLSPRSNPNKWLMSWFCYGLKEGV